MPYGHHWEELDLHKHNQIILVPIIIPCPCARGNVIGRIVVVVVVDVVISTKIAIF